MISISTPVSGKADVQSGGPDSQGAIISPPGYMPVPSVRVPESGCRIIPGHTREDT
jgi:hypothetical protein